MLSITPNPNNLKSSIVDNVFLLELLKSHKSYLESIIYNDPFVLTPVNKQYLNDKIAKLTTKIEYLIQKTQSNGT